MTELFGLEAPLPVVDLDRVLDAVRTVRINRTGLNEFEIHDAIVEALLRHGLPHRREHAFGPRCRADIWVDGVVIEVKKQRPPRQELLDQVNRYAAQPACRAIITVLERSIALPATLNNKPIAVLSLNALWGIAL